MQSHTKKTSNTLPVQFFRKLDRSVTTYIMWLYITSAQPISAVNGCYYFHNNTISISYYC